MKTIQFKILKIKYDLMFGFVGFGFTKYSFKKGFEELKKMSDIAWDKKWKQAGFTIDPKLGE